jgi:RNA-directed DNA polymerase
MFTHKYKDIISMDKLLLAWQKFLCGKRSKKDVLKFQEDLSVNLANLYQDLRNKTYIHGGYAAFRVADPKPRDIHKAGVRDRLVHHLLYQELYPYFDRRFVYDSFSCRNGKGIYKGLERFKYFAEKVSRHNTTTAYILKGDIKKFFASIDQQILLSILKKQIIDQDIIWLIESVLVSFYSLRHGIGLPLGNLTSQLFSNIYLHELDAFIKQELKIKYYIRYADDFVIMSGDKKYLLGLIPKIDEFLNNKLHLSLHEKKVYIKTYFSGLDFIGWVNFPSYRRLRTSTKRKIFTKMRYYPRSETASSYRGLLSHGNTYKIRKKLGME